MAEYLTSPSWAQIRALAIDGVEAALAKLLRERNGMALNNRSVAVPPRGGLLEAWATTSEHWEDVQFYVVDEERGAGRAGDRHPVNLRHSAGRRLRFEIPTSTRMALGGARRVRVYFVSGLEVWLRRSVLQRLRATSRGELVEQLWSEEPVVALPAPTATPGQPLNTEQRSALAAMTQDGAVFVWGPPGTGKTKVITAAVQEAIGCDRTVLIASNTNLAVDNVLEGLIRASDGAILAKPGVVVRVGSSGSLSPAVRDHEFLTVDKAAAVLTKHAERLAEIERRLQDNADDPRRRALIASIEAIGDIDVDKVAAARLAVAALAEVVTLDQQHASLHAELAAAIQRGGALWDLVSAQDEVAVAEVVDAEAAKEAGALAAHRAAAEARITAVSLRRRWAWGDKKRRRDTAEATARFLEADAALLVVEERLESARRRLQRARVSLAAVESSAMVRDDERCDRARAGIAASQADARVLQLRADVAVADEIVSALRKAADAVPGAGAIVDDARQRGLLEHLDERVRLNTAVAELDAERRGIVSDAERLKDDMRKTHSALIAESPVLACTLAALTTTRELGKRRFDVVIIDEVASAEAASVFYAGSLADRTLALVGDFLQNAPIAEVDDATTPRQERQVAWQQLDVFALAGIHSRGSAEAHRRCVALRLQYRYPSVIADVVNAFCYEGMLESHRISSPADGPTITVVDTSGRPDKALEPEGASWHSPLGLNLLASIAHRLDDGAGSVGFVTPYKSQARRARRRMIDEGLDVECGTAYVYQGRERDTVILDLMQDGTERWVGRADLSGPKHAVAAAKLLNVSITRARRRLLLIGDWEFIRHHHTPGMKALAGLEGHPNFEVVDASQLL